MCYTINYKAKFDSISLFVRDSSYDIFLSVYNNSERVRSVFDAVVSRKKHWLILPEYHYVTREFPSISDSSQQIFTYTQELDEGEIIRDYFKNEPLDPGMRVCIDITGFIRPHLIFLLRYLKEMRISKIDFLYSDPASYAKKEDTSFTIDYVKVKSVNGCEGMHGIDTSNDVLIIGSGFDDKRISDVSKDKAHARKVQLFGFPSLQPDMYQQNILKAYKAEESSTGGESNFIDSSSTIFAPANDPFVTAQSISDFVNEESRKRAITNLYLSPLSTKAQTLGFALYYITECIGKPVSIIFPYCSGYSRETTIGISKIWKYTVEF